MVVRPNNKPEAVTLVKWLSKKGIEKQRKTTNKLSKKKTIT